MVKLRKACLGALFAVLISSTMSSLLHSSQDEYDTSIIASVLKSLGPGDTSELLSQSITEFFAKMPAAELIDRFDTAIKTMDIMESSKLSNLLTITSEFINAYDPALISELVFCVYSFERIDIDNLKVAMDFVLENKVAQALVDPFEKVRETAKLIAWLNSQGLALDPFQLFVEFNPQYRHLELLRYYRLLSLDNIMGCVSNMDYIWGPAVDKEDEKGQKRIFKTMLTLAPGDRDDAAVLAGFIREEIKQSPAMFSKIVDYVRYIPPTDRLAIVEAVCNIDDSATLFYFLDIFKMLPVSSINRVWDLLDARGERGRSESSELSDGSAGEIEYKPADAIWVAIEDLEVKTELSKWWYDQLISSDNQLLVRDISKFLLDYKDELGLSDESELIIEANLTSYDLDHIEEPNNRYILFDKLKQLRSEPLTEVVGTQVKPKFLQSMPLVLGEDASPVPYMKGLFDSLAERFKQAEPADDGEILEAYQKACFWLDSANPQKLLDVEGKLAGQVTKAQLEFARILQYIGTLPDAEQFDVFSRFLLSFDVCNLGKEDGIHFYYEELKKEGHIKEDSVGSPEYAAFHKIHTKVEELVESDDFYRGLISVGEVNQKSHQVLYVKNLIAHEVGLCHTLRFDPHTHCIYNELLAKSKMEILEYFYSLVTNEFIFSALKEVKFDDLLFLSGIEAVNLEGLGCIDIMSAELSTSFYELIVRNLGHLYLV